MIVLTAEERARFALWCRQEAASSDGMARQANTMVGLEVVVKKYHTEAMAALIVAKVLEGIEEFTVEKKP